MNFPCNMKDTTFNRHLAKGLIDNNNRTKPDRYCLVTVKGYLQVRKEKDIDKITGVNPAIAKV